MKTKMHKNKKAGLTLIELLIGITIFSVIAASLYSNLNTGIYIWKRSKTDISENRAVLYLFNKLRYDLQSAVSFSSIQFVGEADNLYFCSLQEDLNNPKLIELKKIEYTLTNKNESDIHLTRKLQHISNAISTDPQPMDKEKHFKNVKNIQFEYSYIDTENEILVWMPYWTQKDVLPKYIRIFWEFRNPPINTKTTQTIYIPTGSLTPIPEDEEEPTYTEDESYYE